MKTKHLFAFAVTFVCFFTSACSKKETVVTENGLPQTIILKPTVSGNGYFSIKTPYGYYDSISNEVDTGFEARLYKKFIAEDSLLLYFQYGSYANFPIFHKMLNDDSVRNVYVNYWGCTNLNIERTIISDGNKAALISYAWPYDQKTYMDFYLFNKNAKRDLYVYSMYSLTIEQQKLFAKMVKSIQFIQ